MIDLNIKAGDTAEELRQALHHAPETGSLSVTFVDPTPVFEVLLSAVWPVLHTLILTEEGFDLLAQEHADPPAMAASVMKRMVGTLPALRRLEIAACGLAAGLTHPQLRELVLSGLPFTRGLRQLVLPELVELTWNLPADVHGVAASPAAFKPVWSGQFPSLRVLDVYDADLDGDFYSTAMLTSTAVAGLRVLRAPLIGKPAAVLKHAAVLAHLERFEVTGVEPPARVAALREKLPNLRVLPRVRTIPTRGTLRRFYTFPSEVFVAEWDGFSTDALRDLPASVVSIALYHGVRFKPDEQRAFAREASMRFEELRMPGGTAVGSPLHDDLAIGLAETLPQSRWRRLSLKRARLTRAGVETLAAALTQPSSLRDLTLYSREPGLAVRLAPALPASGLHSLRLNGSWITSSADARTVAAALSDAPDVRSIGLGLDRANDGAFDELLDGLAGATIENLALGNGFTGPRLARTLAAHRSLSALDAAGSVLTDADLAVFADALGEHRSIRSWRATRLDVTPPGIAVLAEAFAASETLDTLDVCQAHSARSRHASYGPLFDAIAAAGRPVSLTMRGSREDEQSLLGLVAANRLTALRGYGFSAQGTRTLLELLPAATALSDLDLADSEFDPADVTLLYRTLPRSSVRTFGFSGGTLLELKKPGLHKLLAAIAEAGVERIRLNVPWAGLLGARGTPTPALRQLLLQQYDDA